MHNQLVSMAASVEGGIIGDEGSLYRSNLRRELFSKRNEVSVKEAFSVLRSYYYFGVRRADTIEMSTDGRRRRTDSKIFLFDVDSSNDVINNVRLSLSAYCRLLPRFVVIDVNSRRNKSSSTTSSFFSQKDRYPYLRACSFGDFR